MKSLCTVLLAISMTLAACAPAVALPSFETDKQRVVDALGTTGVPSLDYYSGYDFANPPANCLKPCTRTWNATFPSSTRVMIGPGWCAVDEQTLASDLAHTKISMTVNGREIPAAYVQRTSRAESAAFEQGAAPATLECAYTGALAYDWPVGTHTVVVTLTFDQDLSDGWNSYRQGSYVNSYAVKVTP